MLVRNVVENEGKILERGIIRVGRERKERGKLDVAERGCKRGCNTRLGRVGNREVGRKWDGETH